MRVDEIEAGREIKAGSVVEHIPTGEQWFLLGVNRAKNAVCVAGWPPSIACLSDCVFVEQRELTEKELEYRGKEFGHNWDSDLMGVEEC